MSYRILHVRRYRHTPIGKDAVELTLREKGGVTIAYELVLTANEELEPCVEARIAFAVCSSSDIYSRKEGRQLALKRLSLADVASPFYFVASLGYARTLKAETIDKQGGYKYVFIGNDKYNLEDAIIKHVRKHRRDHLVPKKLSNQDDDDIFVAVCEIARVTLCVPNTQSLYTDTNIFKDLNADSLERVELMMAVEGKFKIEVSDDEASDLSTIQQVVDLVKSKLPSPTR